jgi:hypothetical protein
MILNKKVINYKVLGLVKLYNFDIKFDFIRDRMKKLRIFFHGTIFRDGSCHYQSLNIPFLGTSDGVTRP